MRRILTPCALAAALALPLSVSIGQEAVTTPVGVVTTSIAGSPNGSSWAITFLAPTLLNSPSVAGPLSGTVSTISSSGFTASVSGWTSGSLATTAAPCYVMFTSGALEGLTLRISANTENALTIATEGIDLQAAGASVGDGFRIVLGDTLISLLGTPQEGIVGGSFSAFNSGTTDRVVTRDTTGVVRTYFYDTASSPAGWRRPGSATVQDNLPISPTSGLIFYRISTQALDLVSTGEVPSKNLRQLVPRSGQSYHARFFPQQTTLGQLGFNQLPTWRTFNGTTVTLETADKLVAKDNVGVLRQFYHDGASWKRVGSSTSQNNVVIPVGSVFFTNRFGGSGAPDILPTTIPYSLQ